MKPFTSLNSHIVAIPNENIDTDQIIPARYLKTTSKQGLGQNLFNDWRYETDGTPRPDFPLNQPEPKGAQILLAGDNFGCGSSREHAPWALMDYGLRAVVSTSFGDIFRQNSLKNGFLPIIVDDETHRQLFSLVAEEPDIRITIDLVSQVLILPDGRKATFPIDTFSKTCLLEGVDQLGYLVGQDAHIRDYEALHPPRVDTSIPPKEVQTS